MKRLEVQLPVCPTCLHIGKWPNGGKLNFTCTGPAGEPHKQAKMVKRVFREVPDGS